MQIYLHFLFLFLLLVRHGMCITAPCQQRSTRTGWVCVCTAAHCDYLEVPETIDLNTLYIVSTSQSGLAFASSNATFGQKFSITKENEEVAKEFEAETIILEDSRAIISFPAGQSFTFQWPFSRTFTVDIDRNIEFQKTTEFGGAFTGAVSHVLKQLSENLQDHVYRSFFHKDGIHFDIIRTSIGGCDFDLEPWTYLDKSPGDTLLANFTDLDPRDKQKLSQIIRLKEIANKSEIKVMAVAWSAPPWMKTNNAWTGFSALKTTYYQAWADYHLRFLELMSANNLPIWAISTGNEPMNGVLGVLTTFLSLGWTPGNMGIWLADHLGPTIRKSRHNKTLIFGNDDQRYTYPTYLHKMRRSRANALDYLDGFAVHWYTDMFAPPNLIDSIHAEFPDKPIINTESCLGSIPILDTRGPVLGSWKRGEHYMRSFLQYFEHNYNGWIDWNLILDEQGGPNYWKNFVDAPILANVTSGTEFYKQPIFYALGHFSKFITPGSVRIQAKYSSTTIQSIAFKRPDSKIIVILFNGGGSAIDVSLNDSVRGSVTLNIPARSFHSILYN